MADPILVVDTSEIEGGNVAEVKRLFADLVAFVGEHEAEPFVYCVYFDETGTRMTVAQIHPSSESMERHLDIASPMFRPLAGLLRLTRVDFYGKPSERLLELTRRKAERLGGAAVVVNELHARFMRFGAPVAAVSRPAR
jgi:hypothetical protein